MKNTVILILSVETLLLASIHNGNGQMVYQIVNDEIVMKETFTVNANADPDKAFQHFFRENNCFLHGTVYNSATRQYTDMILPGLNVTEKYNESRGLVHVDINREGQDITVTLTCNKIRLYFDSVPTRQEYNPATNYPVTAIHDQDKTQITMEDTNTTFESLINAMRRVKTELKKIYTNNI